MKLFDCNAWELNLIQRSGLLEVSWKEKSFPLFLMWLRWGVGCPEREWGGCSVLILNWAEKPHRAPVLLSLGPALVPLPPGI